MSKNILDEVFVKPTVDDAIKLSNKLKELNSVIKDYEEYFNDLNKKSKEFGCEDIEDLIKNFKKRVYFDDELNLRIEKIRERYGKKLKDSTWLGVEDTIKRTGGKNGKKIEL